MWGHSELVANTLNAATSEGRGHEGEELTTKAECPQLPQLQGAAPVQDQSCADHALIRRGKLVGQELLPIPAGREFSACRDDADTEEALWGAKGEARISPHRDGDDLAASHVEQLTAVGAP